MTNGVVGPISGSGRANGIANYAWLIQDRSGAYHTLAIEASPTHRARRGEAVRSDAHASGGAVPGKAPNKLVILVDRAGASVEMDRPLRARATASRPFTLEDGTEIAVFAQSNDGGRTVSCDVYVDGASVGSPDFAAPISQRVALAGSSRMWWVRGDARGLVWLAFAAFGIVGAIQRGFWPYLVPFAVGAAVVLALDLVMLRAGGRILRARGRNANVLLWTVMVSDTVVLGVVLAFILLWRPPLA